MAPSVEAGGVVASVADIVGLQLQQCCDNRARFVFSQLCR
ncbi:hypothetical protein R38712_02273 [Ralstonia pickettii]|uniref:Uncharacterized protein n=1 Tax=Ralstonia pickettii TaxID=329 RepID=A0ABN9HZ61_RALPI|nr:hypothetical protein R38712_02273 [Ralstonia pickettii]